MTSLREDLSEISPESVLPPGTLKCQQIMWNFLRSQGYQMTSMYITAILNVPPSDVAEFFTDVLVNLMASFMKEGCSY